MIDVRIGDARQLIHGLADKSIDCVVTSPPYWGLRDYKTAPIIFDGLPGCEHEWDIKKELMHNGRGDSQKKAKFSEQENIPDFKIESGFCSKCGAFRGQLGLEPTPELFIKHLLDFFDDVKLKLKDEGNVFVNLGDSYSSTGANNQITHTQFGKPTNPGRQTSGHKVKTLPSKCMCLIPSRFAWGMIERGWILRNEIIWAKPNHMPESVTDRLTKAHEVIYHFVKQGKYYYNLDAIRDSHKTSSGNTASRKITQSQKFSKTSCFNGGDTEYHPFGKNPGDVWNITTQPYSESHFAVFLLELVRRPILAGCPPGGTVLDPFAGSGTVGEFCRHNDRNAILFELNPDYKKLIEDRAMLLVPELSKYTHEINIKKVIKHE